VPTFAGAFPTVTAGGELIALDTAGYGPLTGGNTINKSITIAAIPGQTAFVVAAVGTAGFTVAAGAGDMTNGIGWDPNTANTPAVALITMQGGSIKFNTTAMNIANRGTATSQNIWIFSIGNYQPLTGIAQNGTYLHLNQLRESDCSRLVSVIGSGSEIIVACFITRIPPAVGRPTNL
jgi:hypothetical protein